MHAAAEAIRAHGAQAVYTASHRHMAGDRRRGLPSVGLYPASLGDVYRVMSAAYAELGDAACAVDHAAATSQLEKLCPNPPKPPAP